MFPISRTLKTSGSCLWCLEMNFISIFDSFRALASASKPSCVYVSSLVPPTQRHRSFFQHWKESVPYISEPILYSIKPYRSFFSLHFSICKAFQSYNFTKNIENTSNFSTETSAWGKREEWSEKKNIEREKERK